MIYLLFPIIAAALYGLNYTLVEKITRSVNMTTYYVCGVCVWITMIVVHGLIKKEKITVSELTDNPTLLLLIICATTAGSLGWVLTTYAAKHISAHYAAMGEISYPLFTLLFTFLLFGARNFDFTSIVGGILIMIGSFILVYGQAK